jgi:hypothetical protein
MTNAASANIAVVLIDVPGFLDAVLSRELGEHAGFDVMRLDDPSAALGNRREAVVVVRATPASLRRATSPLPDHVRVLGTVAVTEGDDPRGDAYLVSPAGTDVSHREIAQIIRSLAAEHGSASAATRQADRVLSRGES